MKHAFLDESPAERLTAYADEQGADLIVVGTHGSRGPSRWLLGSAAKKSVRGARVPVLTVRADE